MKCFFLHSPFPSTLFVTTPTHLQALRFPHKLNVPHGAGQLRIFLHIPPVSHVVAIQSSDGENPLLLVIAPLNLLAVFYPTNLFRPRALLQFALEASDDVTVLGIFGREGHSLRCLHTGVPVNHYVRDYELHVGCRDVDAVLLKALPKTARRLLDSTLCQSKGLHILVEGAVVFVEEYVFVIPPADAAGLGGISESTNKYVASVDYACNAASVGKCILGHVTSDDAAVYRHYDVINEE